MIRDLTMIFAVLISIVSVSFGFYQTIQARNSHAFIYEQAYRIIGAIQGSGLSSTAKAQLTDKALGTLGTPAPVVDLSRSSADVGTPQICSEAQRLICTNLAIQLAEANTVCTRTKIAVQDCKSAESLKTEINREGCFICFTSQ